MRPISYQMLAVLPALLGLVLVLVSAAPVTVGAVTLMPNVAWLMTFVMVAHYPPAWPRGFAFGLGLLQDILFSTPLGSQALLALLLAQFALIQSQRYQTTLFRLRWLEAAGAMIVLHLLLWLITQMVMVDGPTLRHVLQAGLVNALWYPVFYFVATRLFGALPDAK